MSYVHTQLKMLKVGTNPAHPKCYSVIAICPAAITCGHGSLLLKTGVG